MVDERVSLNVVKLIAVIFTPEKLEVSGLKCEEKQVALLNQKVYLSEDLGPLINV